jgi:hypothetical protein
MCQLLKQYIDEGYNPDMVSEEQLLADIEGYYKDPNLVLQEVKDKCNEWVKLTPWAAYQYNPGIPGADELGEKVETRC